MVWTRNSTMELDTGQLSTLNRMDTSERSDTKLEVLKSVKNQQSNDILSNNNNNIEDENLVTTMNENSNRQRNDQDERMTVTFQEDKCIDILPLQVNIDFKHDLEYDDEKISTATLFHIHQLVTNWLKEKVIDGVFTLRGDELEDNIDDVQNWMAHPRIINKKNKNIVECIFQVQAKATAYQLYQNQKELCQKLSMTITSKSTKMEYVQRIGFLTGPNVHLAVPNNYVREINEEAQIDKGSIEIKKKTAHEKGATSRVLMIYAIQSEASTIDQKLYETEFRRFQYVSFKKKIVLFRSILYYLLQIFKDVEKEN